MAVNGNLPKWASWLFQVGRQFAEDSTLLDPEKRITIALCIPKFDFAASFLALGMVYWHSENSGRRVELKYFQGLRDNWVTFKEKQKTLQGKVNSVPDCLGGDARDPAATCIEIITHKNNATCKIRRSMSHWVKQEYWHTIQPISDTDGLSLEGNREPRQAGRRARNRYMRVHELFSAPEADWITDVNGIVATIMGNRKRLLDEIAEEIPILKDNGHIKLESVLRPTKHYDFRGSAHVNIVSGTKVKRRSFRDSPSLIIEAGSNADDQLNLSKDHSRIILLDRSAPRYREGADVVLEDYRNRRGEYKIEIESNPMWATPISYAHYAV